MMDEEGIFEDEYVSGSELSDDIENEVLGANPITETKDGDTCDYESLSPEDVMSLLTEIIDDVYQITKLPKTIIRLLLDHYKWDKDSLIEQYFEVSKTRLFGGALIMPSLINEDGNLPIIKLRSFDEIYKNDPDPPKNVICDICCTLCKPQDLMALGCRHLFCRSCWVEYITFKIVGDNHSNQLGCPAFKCEYILDDDSVDSLISDPMVRRRTHKLFTNSFVLSSRSMTWCPGVNCTYAVRALTENQNRRVNCQHCGETFCFGCGNPWHEPVPCSYLRLWIIKVEQDGGTSHWLAANTKECPKCHVTIEKNGGCNHMICKNLNCKHEFCWVCLDSWSPHGSDWYYCNRYEEKLAQKARDEQALSRAALERYLHYFNRYTNHAQSRTFESKLYESVQRRMEELQNQGMSWIDVKFVKQVVDVLCQCRRTLMYTYVFAYYLKKNNQSLLFENNQSDLEQATEQLSEFFEWDLSATALTDLKQKLQDKARYCENRRRVLLDHVAEGYEKDMWEHYTP